MSDESLHPFFFFSVLNKNEIQKWSYRLPGDVCSARALCCFVLVHICGRCIPFPLKKYQGVKLPFIPSILHPGSAICCIQIEDFACTPVASPSWSPPLWDKLQRSRLSVGRKTLNASHPGKFDDHVGKYLHSAMARRQPRNILCRRSTRLN